MITFPNTQSGSVFGDEPKTRRLVIVGAANTEIAKLVRSMNQAGPAWDLIGYLDDDDSRWGSLFMDKPVLGGIGKITEPQLADAAVAVSVGQPRARRSIAERIRHAQPRMATLVHPDVDLWGVALGRGVLALEGAILSPNTLVGDHTIISFRAFLGHDVTIGLWCNVAPGAIVNGRCRVGDAVYVGAASVLLPGVELGDGATVGAGSVVTRNVPAGCTVVGNPARIWRRPNAERDFDANVLSPGPR